MSWCKRMCDLVTCKAMHGEQTVLTNRSTTLHYTYSLTWCSLYSVHTSILAIVCLPFSFGFPRNGVWNVTKKARTYLKKRKSRDEPRLSACFPLCFWTCWTRAVSVTQIQCSDFQYYPAYSHEQPLHRRHIVMNCRCIAPPAAGRVVYVIFTVFT